MRRGIECLKLGAKEHYMAAKGLCLGDVAEYTP